MLLCTLVMNKWNDAKLMYVRKYSACCVCVAVAYVRMSVYVFACSTCPLVLCVPVIVQHLLRREFMC